MHYHTQQKWFGDMGGRPLYNHKNQNKWYWVWGEWRSKEYDFLEIRPWSPQVINNRLCFSAFDGEFWRVIWGDIEGPRVDDAYDIVAYNNKPVYIAKKRGVYYLIYANILRSIKFNYQIVFRVVDGNVEVAPFDGVVKGRVYMKVKWVSLKTNDI